MADKVAQVAERLSAFGKKYIVTRNGKQYTVLPAQSSPDYNLVLGMVKRGELPPVEPSAGQQAMGLVKQSLPATSFLSSIGKLLGIFQKNVAEPIGAAVTNPFYAQNQQGQPMGFKEWLMQSRGTNPLEALQSLVPNPQTMQQYQAWQDPMLKLGPLHIGAKGVAESIPWLAIPGAAQTSGALKGVQGAGKLAQAARGIGRGLEPLAVAEQAPGKFVSKAIGKVTEKVKPKGIPSVPGTITTPQGLTARAELAGAETAGMGISGFAEEIRAANANLRAYGRLSWFRTVADEQLNEPLGDLGFGITTNRTPIELQNAGVVKLVELTEQERVEAHIWKGIKHIYKFEPGNSVTGKTEPIIPFAKPVTTETITTPPATIPKPVIQPVQPPIKSPARLPTSPIVGTKTATTGALGTPEERLAELIRTSAVPARAETEALAGEKMQQKVARLTTTREATKGQGWEGYYKRQATLGGEMPKAQMEPVVGKISPEDTNYLLNKPYEYWTEQARLGNLNPRYVELRAQTTETALHRLVVDGLIPQEKELEYLLEVYGEPLIKAILEKSPGSKGFAALMDWLGLPRALQSSIDYSMPLRQTAILTMANPTLSFPSLIKMVRASIPMPFKRWQGQVGEHWAAIQNKRIWNSPYSHLYNLSKKPGRQLEIVSMGKYARLAVHEEGYQTRFANLIPGIKQSQQAAVTWCNQMRSSKFDQVVSKWEREGYNYTTDATSIVAERNAVKDRVANALYGKPFNKLTDVEKVVVSKNPEVKSVFKMDWTDTEALAAYVNIATGRGNLGILKEISPYLNTILYSSRLIASRVELPYILVKATPAVRKEIAKDLVKSAAMLAGDLAFFRYVLHADVQMNPRSSDLGKIKIGNTRVDLMAGYQQYIRLIFAMAGSVAGRNMRTTAKTQYGQATVPQSGWDALTRFGRGKLAPAPGFLTDLMDSKNFIGQEMDANKATVAREAWSRFMPFFIQDLNDAIKQEGLVGGLLAVPGVFGTGTQSYETSLYTVRTTLQEKLANQFYGKPYDALDKPNDLGQKKMISNNPEMQKLNQQIKAGEAKATTAPFTPPANSPSIYK